MTLTSVAIWLKPFWLKLKLHLLCCRAPDPVLFARPAMPHGGYARAAGQARVPRATGVTYKRCKEEYTVLYSMLEGVVVQGAWWRRWAASSSPMSRAARWKGLPSRALWRRILLFMYSESELRDACAGRGLRQANSCGVVLSLAVLCCDCCWWSCRVSVVRVAVPWASLWLTGPRAWRDYGGGLVLGRSWVSTSTWLVSQAALADEGDAKSLEARADMRLSSTRRVSFEMGAGQASLAK